MVAKDLGLVIEQPPSIREKVYNLIMELILAGKLISGERIVENGLAEQLGVSRTPVREALHALEREGFLESLPRIGYQVREIRREDLAELCEIRKVNESLAARLALERITPAELEALEANLAAAETDVQAGQSRRFILRDADFHELLVQASKSRRLIDICQSLRRQMLLYRVESFSEPETATRAIESHRHILDRLHAGDAQGLQAAIAEHLDFAKQDIYQRVFEGKH
jgi:DNA-binding GntR family transcriptional regulator